MEIPSVLCQIVDRLQHARKTGHLILDRDANGMDGRISSVHLKARILDFLKDSGFAVEAARTPRDWYSMAVYDAESDTHIPCKLVVSNGGADNFHNKHAIVYSCTNLPLGSLPSHMNYEQMYNLVRDNLRPWRDYNHEYFLIFIHKRKPVVALRSLCDVEFFMANASNHLQISWNKEVRFRGTIAMSQVSTWDAFERIRSVLTTSFRTMWDRVQAVMRPMDFDDHE